MMEKRTTLNHGFTLIETLLYLALFAIVIGGGMIAAYNIIEATSSNTNHVILQEEANFLLRKIDWALTGAKTVNPSGTNLTITKYDGTSVAFSYNSTTKTLQLNSTPLNSSNISLTGLTFTPTSPGTGVTTRFTLTTAQNGRLATQIFSATKYVRQ